MTAAAPERQSALTALVQQAQEDGFYDPPGAEPLRRHINEQAAEITRLRALVTELADDLEAEINARYSELTRSYPSEQRRYDRDMEIVRKARAALAAALKGDA